MVVVVAFLERILGEYFDDDFNEIKFEFGRVI